MFNGILDAAFLQAACAKGEAPVPPVPTDDEIKVEFNYDASAGNIIISGTGVIKIVYNGQTITLNSPSNTPVEITPIEDETMTIKGAVTELSLGVEDWKYADVDTMNCTTIKTLTIASNTVRSTLGLSASLETLNLPVISMYLTMVKYGANNQSVATSLASAIENVNAAGPSKILSTNSDAPYYSILSTAVTNSDAEWEIRPLS